MQDVLFIIGAFAPIVLDVVAWRRLRRVPVPTGTALWRKPTAYVGFVTNVLAYAIPWGNFLYMYILLNRGRPVDAGQMTDGLLVINLTLLTAAVAFILGAVSPRGVRAPLMFSAVCIAYFWASIPMGVL